MNNYAGECPLCGDDVYRRDDGYRCSNRHCGLSFPLTFEGVEISAELAQKLLGGRMIKDLSFTSKIGKKHTAGLALSESGHLHKVLC